jgi:hypothetical protein
VPLVDIGVEPLASRPVAHAEIRLRRPDRYLESPAESSAVRTTRASGTGA